MNDVYVVHFEFHVAIIPLIFAVLFVNFFVTMFVAHLYYHRKRVLWNNTDPVTDSMVCLFFFTWPLYLILVLVKMTLGGLAKLWSKI